MNTEQGRAKESNFLRNIIIIALGLGALGLGAKQYTNTDSYKNGKILKQAEAQAEARNIPQAMDLYAQVLENSERYQMQAKSGIRKLVNVNALKNTSDADMADVLNRLDKLVIALPEGAADSVYELALSRIKEGSKTAQTDERISVHKLLHAAQTLQDKTEAQTAQPEELGQIDLNLVKNINAADPTNLEAAVEMSEIYFDAGNVQAVKSVLAPVQDRIDDTEGARVLGQVYVAEGNNAAAYPLLDGYIKTRLGTLQAAEKDFTELGDKLWDKEFENLKNGAAPEIFYTAYEQKSEAEQQLFVNEYIGDKVNNNLVYQASLERYRDAASIVPVVMDFSILQLRTAEGMTSPEERNAELKRAENTFLSIKNIVGDTDDYKIYLGRVYFWLGKQDEGQALFDEVMAANKRAPQTLLTIASTLRNLGNVGKAEALTQEAYDNAKDDETRYYAASLMHLFSNKIEDKIKWLERSDPQSPYVQAALNDNKGHLASQKGNSKQAANYYRKAIASSEKLPEDASNDNNTALMYFSLNRVSGDKAAYKKGVELMKRAADLRPDDGILMSNAASILLNSVVADSVDDSIDFQVMQTAPSLENVSYYYEDITGKKAIRKKILQNKDLETAIKYFERSILLSPNSLQNYMDLYSLYYFLDNKVALADLTDKLEKNHVDITASHKTYLDYISGQNKKDVMDSLNDAEKFYGKLLQRKDINKATRGVMRAQLAETHLSKATTSEDLAVSKKHAMTALKLAQNAVKDQPSSYTRSNLIDAHMALASIAAAEQFPTYKAWYMQSKRKLDDSNLIILAINKGGKIGDWLGENPNVKKALDLKMLSRKNFPDNPTAKDWAFIKSSHNDIAAKMAEQIKTSDLPINMQRFSKIAFPMNANGVVHGYWLNQILGKPGIEQSQLDELGKDGIKLPAALLP